jgi:Dynamin family
VAFDPDDPRAPVFADLPWHPESPIAGTLRILDDSLVVLPRVTAGARAAIPLGTISRSTIETTFGTLPALNVWHTVGGREFQSRFEFGYEEPEPGRSSTDSAAGIADRVGPGIARDAAQRLEGGLRALGGGLNVGMRTARQAVDGLARPDQYKAWPAAIAAAQSRNRSKRERAAPQARAVSTKPIVPHDADSPTGDTAAQFRWFRDPLLGWLNDCAARARALRVRGVPVIQPRYPLDSPICRIVVLGEFSRGKSTLINALFGIHGEIALPTGMTPTTPIACAVRVPQMGESDGATVSYRTGRPSVELSIEDFRKGVRLSVGQTSDIPAEGVTPLHLDEARSVEIRITGAYLPAGVEIEDTPGLHEDRARSAGALAALGRADLVLFVLAADQLLGELERSVIHEQLERGFHRNVLFLVNFWDSIEDGAQQEILKTRAAAILGDFPSPFRHHDPAPRHPIDSAGYVYFVSALQAARSQRQHKNAPEESGIPRLRAALRGLLGPGSDALLLRSRSGRALRYSRLLREAVSRAAAAEIENDPGAHAQRRGQAGDQAVVAALRVIDGLSGAVSGATAQQLAGFEARVDPELRRAADVLERAMASNGGVAAPETRRLVASDLRSLAARVASSAQQAVDLILAQARAAYLGRKLQPPTLEARIDPLPIDTPTETDARTLRLQIDELPIILRADLDEKAHRIAAALGAAIRDTAQRASQARAADTASAASARSNADRLTALRVLEDDLLRIEHFLHSMLVQ